MSEKEKKLFSLTSDVTKKIKELSSDSGDTESRIVELAVMNFYEYQKNKTDLNEFSRKVIMLLNELDKNSKMMFQFWNHYFFVNDFEELATTKRVQTKPLMQAKEVVESEIRKARQRKLEKEG